MQSTHLTTTSVASSSSTTSDVKQFSTDLEMFVQSLLLQEIESTPVATRIKQISKLLCWFLPQPQLLAGIWSLIEGYLNEPLRWNFLCKAILNDYAFQNCLWTIIYTSKSSQQHATMAAKAI